MSVTVSTLASYSIPLRSCLLTNGLSGPRLRRPIVRTHALGNTQGEFNICSLSKRHIVSVGIGLAITTLLLVTFATQDGVGAWLYSAAVVLSMLALVFLAPFLLCLCYYRRINEANARRQAEQLSFSRMESATQTSGEGADISFHSAGPNLYTCIIIAPQSQHVQRRSGYSDLPCYDEALVSSRPSDEKSESPPPSYMEALSLIQDGPDDVTDLTETNQLPPCSPTRNESHLQPSERHRSDTIDSSRESFDKEDSRGEV